LKPNDKVELYGVVELLQNGRAQRKDLITLLALLREYIPKESSTFLDIAHCVAHNERDRGVAFDYISNFLQTFVLAVKKGGMFTVDGVFSMDVFLTEMHDCLHKQGIGNADLILLRANSGHIVDLLSSILDRIVINIQAKHIQMCAIEEIRSQNGNELTFQVNFKGLQEGYSIRIPRSVPICFPFFKISGTDA